MATVANAPPAPSPNGRYKDPLASTASGIDVGRLALAIRRSRRVLEFFRSSRREAVRAYVGAHWSRSGSDKIMPVNLVARFIDVTARALVSREPRAMLSTMQRKMQPAVSAMQAWMNKRVQEMHFGETLRRFVTDALYGLGIIKVGIAAPHDEAVEGYAAPAGVPFAECVDLDDFAFDPGSTSFERAGWIAHRFSVPYDAVKDLKYFKAEGRKFMKPRTAPLQFNDDGDETIKNLGRAWEADPDYDHEDMVDLWEVYLPRVKKVVTLACDDGGSPIGEKGAVLRVVDWFGPPCGPYHFLGFGLVPGNPMPKAPVSNILDLNRMINHIYRKLFAQAARQKDIYLVRGSATEDGGRTRDANDGDMISCDDPDGVQTKSHGGPNPANFQLGVHLQDVLNEVGGNLRLLGGGGPQAKTATQENLLNENAGADVSDKQDATAFATAKILRSLGWFWWNHPQEVMTSSRSLPGLPDFEITRRLYPATVANPPGGLSRKGRFEDIALRIDPYSMRYKSPQQRLQFLFSILTQTAPFMPMWERQGVQMDWQFLFKKIAEYGDEPDIIELFSIGEPPATVAGGGAGTDEDPRMPAATSRNYTRTSVGQDTAANRGHELMNELSSTLAGGEE